jgi:peptidoglycan/LPS O-acetylase OafA/YrhL
MRLVRIEQGLSPSFYCYGRQDVESVGALEVQRNTQIDGWRAFAVLGVTWHHWVPRAWRGEVPFEIGLFFFLTLTGFLITRILLKERRHACGGSKGERYSGFLRRRFGRIVVPCTVAMVFALVFGATDIRENPWWYFLHLSNFHMAVSEAWPSGTAPLWTLAIQVQFYIVWPLLLLWLPVRMLPRFFVVCLVAAPVFRWIFATHMPWVHHAEAIPLCALDYFGAGALLAWMAERSGAPDQRWARLATGIGWAAYLLIYVARECGMKLLVPGYLQQTFLAIGMAGLIGLTLIGFRGRMGRVLEHPALQHVGRISYGLYLFHSLVPLFLGFVFPFLWWNAGPHDEWMTAARIVVFAFASWGMAWACWRWLEGGGRSQRGNAGTAKVAEPTTKPDIESSTV